MCYSFGCMMGVFKVLQLGGLAAENGKTSQTTGVFGSNANEMMVIRWEETSTECLTLFMSLFWEGGPRKPWRGLWSKRCSRLFSREKNKSLLNPWDLRHLKRVKLQEMKCCQRPSNIHTCHVSVYLEYCVWLRGPYLESRSIPGDSWCTGRLQTLTFSASL